MNDIKMTGRFGHKAESGSKKIKSIEVFED